MAEQQAGSGGIDPEQHNNTATTAITRTQPLAVKKLEAASDALKELIKSLLRPVSELDVVFPSLEAEEMASNHRRRLAEWLIMFHQKHGHLASRFMAISDAIQNDGQSTHALHTAASTNTATTSSDNTSANATENAAGTSSSVTQAGRFQFSLLPPEVQVMIFSYAAEPPKCKHFFYAVTYQHRMLLDTLQPTNTARIPLTALFENHPAIELMPDRAFWMLCTASRFAMQREYSRWRDEMEVRPYCMNTDRSDFHLTWDGESDAATDLEGGRRARRDPESRPFVYRSSMDWVHNVNFVQWTNADGLLFDHTEQSMDSSDDATDSDTDDDAGGNAGNGANNNMAGTVANNMRPRNIFTLNGNDEAANRDALHNHVFEDRGTVDGWEAGERLTFMMSASNQRRATLAQTMEGKGKGKGKAVDDEGKDDENDADVEDNSDSDRDNDSSSDDDDNEDADAHIA
ncbi:hypothetical protein HMPREF1624_03796 [Sporothrix schenckii ATCC 58251]|uniref:Uncharacterized protein n=1 Tax=Sporothrix schenckii (strain ATCC 58251 / de Perez 2211183) TaxID=1391915 RepID=U7Q0D8_SPOS1|nr:hypothetical protein HMPREF1624_03796 [Sporothrix schenckii ATCC 58251]